jgi:PilZ domain-containing protein
MPVRLRAMARPDLLLAHIARNRRWTKIYRSISSSFLKTINTSLIFSVAKIRMSRPNFNWNGDANVPALCARGIQRIGGIRTYSYVHHGGLRSTPNSVCARAVTERKSVVNAMQKFLRFVRDESVTFIIEASLIVAVIVAITVVRVFEFVHGSWLGWRRSLMMKLTSSITDTGDTSALPPIVDRRVASRTPVLLRGIVARNNGDTSLPCTVQDYSDTGARIHVSADANLPEHLFLILVRLRVALQAEVMWYGHYEAGLTFTRSVKLSDDMDGELAYLNELWHAAAPV